MSYKRNQIEEAIARIRSKLREASFGVAHAIKRLLELDRSIARTFECPNVKPAGII
jgi:hypothetical protein